MPALVTYHIFDINGKLYYSKYATFTEIDRNNMYSNTFFNFLGLKALLSRHTVYSCLPNRRPGPNKHPGGTILKNQLASWS